MLEIFFLMFLVRKLSAIAKSKGRSGSWGGLGALFWIGGEIVGLTIGVVAFEDVGGGAYLVALGLAALGAFVAYIIVNSLSPATSRYEEIPRTVPTGYTPPHDPSNPYTAPRY